MNQNLQTILNLIQQSEHLSDEEKIALSNAAKSADKELEITAFKLDRTEKVKHTTGILLEETIAELEQKRKAVEAQNRELEIEASLERVRAVAMSMNKPGDMLDVCSTISNQLESLKVKEIRNIQTAIFYEAKGTYMNYEYYAKHNKTFITETSYTNHEIHQAFANQMLKGKGEFFERHINSAELPGWIAYQKTTNVFIDTFLETATSLNYYWYSLGPVALGISTYSPLNEEAMNLFKRFLKVFELSYRRYLDIETAEEQAREARIETALEKIRSRSLAMHKSDELWEVVAVVFEKLQELKFSIDGAAFIVTFIEGSRDLNTWLADIQGQLYPSSLRLPYYDSPSINDIWLAKESGLDFFSKTYSFEEKNHWLSYAFENSDLKIITDEFKTWILEQPCMTQSCAFGKNSMIGVHFHHQKTLSETEVDILKRFSKVFDQAYIRFLDLKKAEAQARESQIQLAMERVRARTMAMQHSNELSETSALLFQQIKALGVPPWSCGFNIWEKGDTVFTSYMGSPDGAILEGYKIPLTEEAAFIHFQESRDRGDKLFIDMLEGERLEAHYRYFLSLPEIKKTFEKRAQAGEHHPTFQINHLANFSHGNLLFITYEPCPDAHDIFIRFAKVFEQTYIRFLDLQKAEEQARESQIQLALERVRARTMAMQRSDELQDAASVMVQQIQTLGVPQFGSGFNIWDDDRKAATAWMCNITTDNLPPPFKTSSSEDIFLDIHDAAQRGESLFVREQAGKELETHYRYMNSIPIFREYVESASPEGLVIPDFQIMHCAFFSQGYLMFITYEHVPEAHDIFIRFAKVFEQTYTRFLDLQKAEAQAREAKIEAALEKVRSRTMAMQHSNELAETSSLLDKQLRALGIQTVGCAFNIYDEDQPSSTEWFSNLDGNIGTYKTPREGIFLRYYEKWQQGETLHVEEITGNACVAHYEYLSALPGIGDVLNKLKESGIPFPSSQIDHVAYFKYGYLLFITFEPAPEVHDVFKRFAKVFEQTYTRFLDLQKAEAQARESQIQLALERVRARTMAMYDSSELSEAAALLFDQLKQLGVELWGVGFAVCETDNLLVKKWTSIGSSIGQTFHPIFIPYNADRGEQAMYDAWKNQIDLYEEVQEGKDLKKIYEDLWKIPSVKVTLQKTIESGLSIPVWQKNHVASFKHGYLLIITTKPFEETQVFVRFAKVFEQTYTRFLDLQKAEAQARESQIQLAMERVRARTMAMQHSDELADASHLLERQVATLGIKTWGCAFHIFRENDSLEYHSNADGVRPIYVIPRTYIWQRYYEACQRGESLIIEERAGKACTELYEYLAAMPIVGEELQKMKAAGIPFPTYQVEHAVSFKYGYLLFITFEQVPEAHDIFIRFAKVFEQTYTRFLDLQKAETQAREAQIEAALERVRSRSMGMQKSDELRDVIQVIFEQLIHLDFNIDGAGFGVDFRESDDWNLWVADRYLPYPNKIHIPYFDHPYSNAIIEAKRTSVELLVSSLTFEEKNKMWDHVFKYAPAPEDAKELVYSSPGFAATDVLLKNVELFIENYAGIPYTDAENSVLKRFGKVFEQTYTRFNDLKQAEAQAREAQIEAALEKVRSRTMAMQRSAELAEVAAVLFQQVKGLGVPQWTCGVCIFEIDDKEFTWYPGSADDIFPPGKIPLNEHPVFIQFNESRKRGDELYVYEKGGEVQAEHYRYMLSLPGVREYMQSRVDAGFQFPSFQIDHLANFSHGNIVFITYEHFPEMHDVFKRFAKVFDQTYTRFLDLQKSEAQAREAKIEAALERVRSRTMAMQHSDELGDVAEILFKQVKELGIHAWTTGFNIWQEGNNAYIDWITNPSGGFVEPYMVDLTAHPFFREISDAKKRGDDFQVFEISGEPLAETYALLMSFAPKQFEGFLASGFSFPTRQVNHYVFGAQVGLMFITPEPYPEAHDIFKRFGKVFEQTYTRFLDLQKSEAQVREAQIEAALERVRSRTMGMQKSDELKEAAQLLFQQVQSFGANQWACGYNIWEPDGETCVAWMSRQGILQPPFKTSVSTDTCFRRFYDAKQRGEIFYVEEIGGDEIKEHYKRLLSLPEFKSAPQEFFNEFIAPEFQIFHIVHFPQGYLMFITYEPVPQLWDIFKRFGKVFEQTYTRFLDLQKAEAQAREAIKRASVDRVRAEIASMRTINDLERITPLIWNELTTLGVPFIRCGVFIMDEEKQELQTHLSTPDGKAIAAFRLPYNAPGETARIIASWHKKDMYKQHWNEAQFIEFTTNLVQQGAVTSGEKYLTENRPTNLYLHFLPFLQGMLYAGNTAPLSDDELHLMQDLADAFSTAYARYEDFNKLEAAKKQVDSTLNELQATQKQLIQSEKMASLGELTAGIAHEIQNPLNFVNNFSEVSNELIGEMVEEVDKGNTAEVKAIALDVQQNLEKILHHGKRADSIVKGMLQHSRKSTGQKEPTDINVLADECLRLSYHGLRAKEKSFNATINTNFDESIGKINIVPQDIGRVLLNTINNAFYAVSERRKAAGEGLPAGQAGFKPTVSVSTKKENDKVTISVRDNGNGIPKKIVDKIFQPFFTTKPTGSGTGLGLSLSYDIVKAHGGEIKVETKEGEGSEFIIQLPI